MWCTPTRRCSALTHTHTRARAWSGAHLHTLALHSNLDMDSSTCTSREATVPTRGPTSICSMVALLHTCTSSSPAEHLGLLLLWLVWGLLPSFMPACYPLPPPPYFHQQLPLLHRTKGHKPQPSVYKSSPAGAACLLWDVSPVTRAPPAWSEAWSRNSFSDCSPPAADLTVFTPQTLLSDTCCAPRKQVSVPLIRAQPCGDSAEKPPVECVVCVPESSQRARTMWSTCRY